MKNNNENEGGQKKEKFLGIKRENRDPEETKPNEQNEEQGKSLKKTKDTDPQRKKEQSPEKRNEIINLIENDKE